MNSIGTLSIAVFSLLGFACGGAIGPVSPDDAPARISRVQSALEDPSGTVSVATAKQLLVRWQAFERVHAAFDAILFLGAEAGKPCLRGSQDAGVYDLGCLTTEQVRGQMTFQSRAAPADGGLLGVVDVTLEDACVGDACVSANGSVDIVPADCAALTTVAVTATISWAGASAAFSFGAQGGIGRASLLPRVVYFDGDGATLLVDGEGGPDEPGPYLVSGAARSFECMFRRSGGQCAGANGATSFSF